MKLYNAMLYLHCELNCLFFAREQQIDTYVSIVIAFTFVNMSKIAVAFASLVHVPKLCFGREYSGAPLSPKIKIFGGPN